MRESEGKRKGAGTVERFLPILLMSQKVPLYSVWLGGFYSQPIIQITKNYKNKHYYKEKVGRKPKREQKAKTGSRKSRMNSGKMVNSAAG